MNAKAYREWLAWLNSLSRSQRKWVLIELNGENLHDDDNSIGSISPIYR